MDAYRLAYKEAGASLSSELRRLTNRNWGVSMRYQLFKTRSVLYAAGLITLVSPTAISSASTWIIGFDVECGWLTGGSGESRVLK